MHRLKQATDQSSFVALNKAGSLSGVPRMAMHLQAEEHLLFVLVGFAGSVILTRSFLEWTGYPQIATGELHIAHVVWGGLLLFAAALLPLIWRGRTIYRLASAFAGVGFGLFIDEVGKFITQSNDYFYPLAAPIIYAFFLLTVLVYLSVRRSGLNDRRRDLSHVVALLETGVDPGTSREQYQAVKAELERMARTAPARAARLAELVGGFLEVEGLQHGEHERHAVPRWTTFKAALNRWLTHTRLRRGLLLGFALLALRGLVSGLAGLIFTVSILQLERWQQLGIPATPLSAGGPFTTVHLIFVAIALTFEGIVGGLFAGATVSMLVSRIRRGLELGYWGLLLSLTALRLLVFYFNQFDVILTTLLQFALLLGLLRYRRTLLLAVEET